MTASRAPHLRWYTAPVPPSPAIRLALVLATVATLLSPCLGADFAWDDSRTVVLAPRAEGMSAIHGYFATSMMGSLGEGDSADAGGVTLYRPVFLSVLAIEAAAFGRDRPGMFHGTGLLLHLLVCALVWALARRWAQRGPAAEIAVLWFGLHPVTAEAVLFVSAQSELLMALLLLAALLVADGDSGARKQDAEAPFEPAGGRSAGGPWRAAAAAPLVLLALLSKETVLLALPVVTWWLRIRGGRWRDLLLLWLPVGAWALLRELATATAGPSAGRQGLPGLAALVEGSLLVLGDGLRSLPCARPIGLRHLSFEYAHLGPAWAAASAATLSLLGVAAWLLRRRAPLLLVAAGVFLGMVGPVVLVATVPGWGGFGRYLYLPAAFLALAVVQGAGELWRARPRARAALAVLGGLALAASLSGLGRALDDWRSNESLGRSQVRNRPDLGVGYGWLGQVDLDRGDWAAAAEHYRLAIEVDPGYHPAFQNLAICLLRMGQAAEALRVVGEMEALHGVGRRSSFARALGLAQIGDEAGAARIAVRALDRAPGDPDVLWLLDNLLAHSEDRTALERLILDELGTGLPRARLEVLPRLSASPPAVSTGSGPGNAAPGPRSTPSP